MDININVQYLVFLVLFGFSGSSEPNCHRVRTEYQNRKIGNIDFVPVLPIHDNGIQICFDPVRDPSRLSCCSRQSEQQYVLAARKYLKDTLHGKTAYLNKLILDHISQFEERISSLIAASENKTRLILNDIYGIPHSESEQPLSEFYSQIKLFMKEKQISLYGAVATFYDKIFPYVLEHNFRDGNAVTFTKEQRECLQRSRQDIDPSPFGVVPYNISHSLQRALSNVKSYLEVLSLIVEAINLTEYANVTDKCVEQITQLHFCSHCSNETQALPCKGLCLNTMRRCLAQFSLLHQDWKQLMMAIVRLDGGQSQKYNVEVILQKLDYQIDISINQAARASETYYNTTKSLCHLPTPKPGAQSVPLDRASHQLESQLKSRNKRDLYDQMIQVKENLLISMNMFDTLSEDICDQEIIYDQNPESLKCWNGTAVGKFTSNVEHLQAFTSSEMFVDPQLTIMKEKLSLKRNTLEAEQQAYKDSMMSDTSITRYGSGDMNYAGGIRLETDDEDLEGTGSGSGDGSGDKGDVTVVSYIPSTIKIRVPTTPRPPRGVASHVTVSIVMVLLTTAASLIL